ncbi:unnamed protein product [Protopolystoma xenopodis]|uniref:Uncharacterized protein n=1 Tax=Protopolystoma xenopodis TaxID=117903 RepID=A0A3S5AGB1_9PLAT|nr:unnamed protein product [Protopolystoma xenopodis]
MWSHRKPKERCRVGKTFELFGEVLGLPSCDLDETVSQGHPCTIQQSSLRSNAHSVSDESTSQILSNQLSLRNGDLGIASPMLVYVEPDVYQMIVPSDPLTCCEVESLETLVTVDLVGDPKIRFLQAWRLCSLLAVVSVEMRKSPAV